jgi:pyruvate,water dikinase
MDTGISAGFDESHYTSPITPLGASTYLPAKEDGTRVMCQQMGALMERLDHRAIGHEVYTHAANMGGKEGPPPPSWIIFILTRLMPSFRKSRRIAQEAMRSMERNIESWHQEWRAEFRQEAKNLNSVNLAELNDEEVIEHFDMTIDFLRRGQNTHFLLVPAYISAVYELHKVCKELLDYDTAKALSLVSGLSDKSSEPAHKLAELAATIKEHTVARDIITDAGPDTIMRLRQSAPDIARTFETYLDEYGHRAMDYDPGSTTLAENPQLLARLLRDHIIHSSSASYDPVQTRKQAVESARSALSPRPKEERERFEKTLEAAERAYPVREDNIFYTDNVPNALIHYAALEIGRRLAPRGLLRHAEDAVYLEDAELRAALLKGEGDYASIVNRRKAERAWVEAHPGPSEYGKDYGPPDPRALPEPLRTTIETVVWGMSSDTYPSAPPVEGKLIGAAASPGRYTGTVRTIHNESEFSQLAHGDVLVCPITTPTWSVLFGQAGAIVTDNGGVLSHAAIIAREHGIPAVLGTGNATQRLKNGQTIVVDGTNGVVQITS